MPNLILVIVITLHLYVDTCHAITTRQYPTSDCTGEAYTEMIIKSGTCTVPVGSRLSTKFDCTVDGSSDPVFKAESYKTSTDCTGTAVNTTMASDKCVQLNAKMSQYVDCSNGNRIMMSFTVTLIALTAWSYVLQ